MKLKLTGLLALLSVTALPALAWAQDEKPALDEMPSVQTDVPEPRRAAPSAAAPAAAPTEAVPTELPGAGTTVVGEREAPIGLFIMPWRQSQAEGGLDRPARLLDEELRPLDPEVFKRQVDYNRALSEHLQKAGRATP
jgi:hypothetical protein